MNYKQEIWNGVENGKIFLDRISADRLWRAADAIELMSDLYNVLDFCVSQPTDSMRVELSVTIRGLFTGDEDKEAVVALLNNVDGISFTTTGAGEICLNAWINASPVIDK